MAEWEFVGAFEDAYEYKCISCGAPVLVRVKGRGLPDKCAICGQQKLVKKDDGDKENVSVVDPSAKPLKDWTLNELKIYCKTYIGKCSFDVTCPFKMICYTIEKDKYRVVEGQYPLNWNLDNMTPVSPNPPARWTKKDIDDARTIRDVFPGAETVKRSLLGAQVIVNAGGIEHKISGKLIPNLKRNECVAVQEILDTKMTRE